jgi:hypothetical protein
MPKIGQRQEVALEILRVVFVVVIKKNAEKYAGKNRLKS